MNFSLTIWVADREDLLYGIYGIISGNEPSLVALFKSATKARLLYCKFEDFHEDEASKSKTFINGVK